MYTIYSDGKLLYAPHLIQEGCGVFSPRLTLELNKAGSLEYTLPPSNVLYNDVQKLKSLITVFQNGEELFRGRVLHDEKDFYRQKKVYCEGELSFLLDSLQRPYTFTGSIGDMFRTLISNHNARVDADKRFTIGTIEPNYALNVYFENKNYSSTLDELNSQLLDIIGGYLKIRSDGSTRYIDWLMESGETSSQTIEFGINLLDITEHISAEDVFTVLVPVGATLTDGEGNTAGKLTISSVNGGKDYLEDSTAISLFGRIERVEEWSDIENASELKAEGEYFLSKNIEMAVTLSVKAVDLHLLDVSTEKIRLGDWVRVISIPHDLNKEFQCTKIVYDLINPDQTEYTFGVSYRSLTEQQAVGSKNVQNVITQVNNASSSVANTEKIVVTMSNDLFNLTERVDALEEGGADGKDGEDGATFIPSVSSEGVISWTNNGGLPNPSAVNITGPQGPAGVDGEAGPQGEPGEDGVSVTHSWEGTVLTITSASGTSSADLKGEKGDKGDPGEGGSSVDVLAVYPVGSIYMSVLNVNPSSLFGGTWERIQDRFLLAAGSSYAAGSTGGEATHVLTVEEMPSHYHDYASQYPAGEGGFMTTAFVENTDNNITVGCNYYKNTSAVGDSAAHNNMPPYLAVYMWKRTA